ncbi:polysaccharide deacetylase family protein [Pseudomonas alliivorans]|nr:polysaccharide deacetylase family protein [Pseudomonas alliivorans]MEE4905453.1 polysaccharide deacetylase family protein [Pseudomonas alliivorans]
MFERPDTASERSVLLVLHDVAPHSWPIYEPFVAAVDQLGAVRMTWLVVPDFHRRSPLGDDTVFQRRMSERLERGDELALHGYYHCDDSPAPRSLRDYFMRRIYTWEGEFYGLNSRQALARLEAGIEVFRRQNWPLHGFVAPAWLMSQGTRDALRQLPLGYTSDSQHLFRLPDFTPIDAPGIVWSARSAWRRTASRLYSDFRENRLREAPTLRLGLHPVDMLHTSSRTYWFELLTRLLEDGRQPMTKVGWLESLGTADDVAR